VAQGCVAGEDMNTDLQIRDESVHSRVNEIRQLMQKWNDRLTLDNLRLSERYLKDGLEIHISFRTCRSASDFCAIFQYWNDPAGTGRSRAEHGDLSGGPPEGEVRRKNNVVRFLSVNGHEQSAVLVDVVKLVEFPEIASITTLVRLNSVHETYNLRANSLYHSSTVGFVFGRSLANGEVRSSGNIPIGFDQLPSQMVQTATQLAERFASNNRELLGDVGANFNVINDLASIRILLSSETIRFGIAESAKPAFQVRDVLIGPFDFRPDASQSVSG
jgi:hypothetical protein